MSLYRRLLKDVNVALIITTFLLTSCSLTGRNKPQKIKLSRILMGTLVEITVVHHNRQEADKAIKNAFEEMEQIEGLMSKFIKTSDVYRINENAGKDFVEVDDEVYHVIEESIRYSELSNGAFDITIGAVDSLWDFEKENSIPSPDEISSNLHLVDYHNITLRDNRRIKLQKPGMMIDMGGVAKGYAVDKGIEVLKRFGIKNAIINAGGDLRAIGKKATNKPWHIGIQHPRDKTKILTTLDVENTSIATSGDYQKYFVVDNVRYHHILDPKTGGPAKGCQSVTIMANDAITADIVATVVFVKGPYKGMKFIESLKDIEGIIISTNGKEMISSGLKGKVKLKDVHQG